MEDMYQRPQVTPNNPGNPKKNIMAIIGMILGIVSLPLAFLLFPVLLAIAGLILSIFGVKSQKKPQAITGIVTSSIGVLIVISLFIVVNTSSQYDRPAISSSQLVQSYEIQQSAPPVSSEIATSSEIPHESSNTEISQPSSYEVVSSETTSSNPSGSLGTRKNPAKIGDTIYYKINSVFVGKANLEITMTDIIRGEEAAAYLTDSNIVFWDELEEGTEYVIPTFKVKNIKLWSSDDKPIPVNTAQFSFSDSSFAKDNQINLILNNKALGAELYEGAETSGIVIFISKEGEACYAIFDNEVWFLLE